MARVLVVSRNPAMAMGLSATEHDIVELKPSAFGDWIAGGDEADALVLDLEAPALAAAAVVNLRAHGKAAPALLVSSDRPGWDAPELTDLANVTVLPQPVTRVALLSAVEPMLTAPPSATGHEPFLPNVEPIEDAPPPNTAEALSELRRDEHSDAEVTPNDDDEIARLLVDPRPPVDDVPAPAAAQATSATASPPATPHTEQAGSTSGRPRRRRQASGPPGQRPGDDYTLSAVPRTRRTSGTAQPTKAVTSQVLDDLDQLRAAPPAPDRSGKPASQPGTHRRERSKKKTTSGATLAAHPVPKAKDDPVDLVRRLSAVTGELCGVPETAQFVIADAVEKVKAGAGAVLCPDGEAWRVAGGIELRKLEHRAVLGSDAWLVHEVAEQQLGVIIEDSDIAREKLHGAPLASWRHLLAAPVPEVRAVLLVARREDVPFSEDDLAALAALGTEAGPLLKAAMDTRELARRLSDLQDDG